MPDPPRGFPNAGTRTGLTRAGILAPRKTVRRKLVGLHGRVLGTDGGPVAERVNGRHYRFPMDSRAVKDPIPMQAV